MVRKPSKAGKPAKPRKPAKPGAVRADIAAALAAAGESTDALVPAAVDAGAASGEDILALARDHIGEAYVLGARAPMANPNHRGPWDCAEFCSWCVFQTSGVLFGVRPVDDPVKADAYTGFWHDQSLAMDCRIPLADAFITPGACLLRAPRSGAIGHIAFSDGTGGTVEARGSNWGVGAFDGAPGRRWDTGVLVPGVRYLMGDTPLELAPPPPHVLRVTSPMMKGPRVKKVQQRLAELGFAVGDVDGIYGPQTERAVRDFQNQAGLTPDGEVGPDTLGALGI